MNDVPELSVAIGVMKAYLTAVGDHGEAMNRARQVVSGAPSAEVIESLINLSVFLLSARQGERGVTWDQSFEEIHAYMQMIEDWA